VLEAHDLHALMEREPRIAAHIREVARSRLGHDVVTPHGDLVIEEIEGADSFHEPAAGSSDHGEKLAVKR
jgi:voltage-gated potassium channel